MGREVRMVPPSWQHPKNADGKFIPQIEGSYHKALAEYREEQAHWAMGEELDWSSDSRAWTPKGEGALQCKNFVAWAGIAPRRREYMKEFKPGIATHFMMYENTSEGTPISPAFPTAESLAHWLADTGASAFGDMTASYEGWLSNINRGSAISMVMSNGVLQSGVEAMK